MKSVHTEPSPGSWPLTVSGVAEIIGVQAQTIRRWADAGHLPCWRTPNGYRRFRREDVDALLTAGASVPA